MNFPLLAVPIIAKTDKEALADMEKAITAGADILEFRIDYMPKIVSADLKNFIYNSSLPAIVTNRARDEGGYYTGTERRRIELLEDAAYLKAHYVDIELRHMPKSFNKNSSKLIVSYHDFKSTPENLEEIYRKILDAGADIIKIATKANYGKDVKRMNNLIEMSYKSGKPIIGICMGELGRETRFHPKNYLTFPCLPGKNSAPGQVTIEEMINYKNKISGM